ncbi:MAG: FtsH protease activity modulator HflK [Beijerinckiaceae bacterium]
MAVLERVAEDAQALDPAAPDTPAPGTSVPSALSLFTAVTARAKEMLRLPHLGRRGVLLLGAFAFTAWAASGIYKVGPDEQGLVLRLGRWVATEAPGLHYRWPSPITTVLLPRVTNVNELQSSALIKHQEPGWANTASHASGSRMLTGDENIVEADYSVLWKIKDAGAYLFHVHDPQGMIRMVAETTVRAVIGRNPIQAVLSDRRQQIAIEVQSELQRLLDSYGAGILVIQVQLQRVDPPAAVIDAFNDVQRARADQVRARNEAEAYRNDILPRARGQADHIVQDAEAYRTQAIDQAQGDVSAFLSAYKAYQQAPEVFSWRLYLDSMDQVLRRASRVVVDSSGKGMSGVVPYMPLGEPLPHGGRDIAQTPPPAAPGGKP